MRTYDPFVSVAPSATSTQVSPDFFCSLMPSTTTLSVMSAARASGAFASSGSAAAESVDRHIASTHPTTMPMAAKSKKSRCARKRAAHAKAASRKAMKTSLETWKLGNTAMERAVRRFSLYGTATLSVIDERKRFRVRNASDASTTSAPRLRAEQPRPDAGARGRAANPPVSRASDNKIPIDGLTTTASPATMARAHAKANPVEPLWIERGAARTCKRRKRCERDRAR